MDKEWGESPSEWSLINELEALKGLSGDAYRQQWGRITEAEPWIKAKLAQSPVHEGQVEHVICWVIAREDANFRLEGEYPDWWGEDQRGGY